MFSRPNVVIAIVLAAFCALSSGAVYLVVSENFETNSSDDIMPTLNGYSEISSFLDVSRSKYYGYSGGWFSSPTLFGPTLTSGGDSQDTMQREAGSPDYSGTNVQVSGIDEADIIKTDGKYIYVSSGDTITIIDAYPAETMGIVASIDISKALNTSGFNIDGIFIFGQRLVVIAYSYGTSYFYGSDVDYAMKSERSSGPITSVLIFDIDNIEQPDLAKIIQISGSVITSRMMDGIVYVVSQQWVSKGSDDVYGIPAVYDGEEKTAIDTIGYDPDSEYANSFVNFLSVDIEGLGSHHKSVIAASGSTVYMSPNAIYLTYEKGLATVATAPVGGTASATEEENAQITTVYKITVDGLKFKAVAKGDILGWPHNQFSMDEWDGHLRVATTYGWNPVKNGVFVLDDKMNVVGTLKGIAPTERIYSARFVGPTAYLVTFRQMDPLFVIDVGDPANPKILGELTMPGFSDYLHPIDDTHLIGVGSISSHVKIALFDVSDPMNPIEADNYTFSDYSYTEVGYDHHAFFYDAASGTLVVPVQSWDYYDNDSSRFYVFTISVTDGIALKGKIGSNPGYGEQRTLYIGEYIYVLDGAMLSAYVYSDLSFVSSVSFEEENVYYGYPYAVDGFEGA